MNTADVKTIKMFGPCIADPSRIVNRDIAACDEQAYKAAGYKRGSISEVSEVAEPQPVKTPVLGSEEISIEEPAVEPVAETPAEAPTKSRRKKSQN